MNIILEMYIATNPSKKSQTALLCYLHTKERRADAKREAKPVFQPEVSVFIGMIKIFEKIISKLFFDRESRFSSPRSYFAVQCPGTTNNFENLVN